MVEDRINEVAIIWLLINKCLFPSLPGEKDQDLSIQKS